MSESETGVHPILFRFCSAIQEIDEKGLVEIPLRSLRIPIIRVDLWICIKYS